MILGGLNEFCKRFIHIALKTAKKPAHKLGIFQENKTSKNLLLFGFS